jgi:hypothetical protein
MGQYFKMVNLDKKEYITPYKLGAMLKWWEHIGAQAHQGAVLLLLADGLGRGGGDFRVETPIAGRWAGDRIVFSGDYADEGKYGFKGNVWDELESFTDITDIVVEALELDSGMKNILEGGRTAPMCPDMVVVTK